MNAGRTSRRDSGGERSTLVERYQSLPRSMKWMLWLAVAVGGYFGIVEPMLIHMGQLNLDTEERLAAVDSLENRGRTTELRERIELQYGQPRLVAASDRGSLQPLVRRVLTDNGITAPTSSTDPDSFEIPRVDDPSTRIRVQRSTVSATFVASPEVVTSILQELEGDPNVSRIRELTLKRNVRDRSLEVRLVVESWSLASATATQGG